MPKLIARLLDGSSIETTSIEALPREQVVELQVISEREGVPPVLIVVDVAAGERVHRFTRNVIRTDGVQEQGRTSVEVYEVQKDGKLLARLYWHPDVGPVLSAQDLYF